MRIKKYKRNEYILAQDVWVRNPHCGSEPLDINNLSKSDMSLFMKNETDNIKKKSMNVDDLVDQGLQSVILCSDGYDWQARHKILADIPNKKVKILGTNGSLAKWELVGSLSDKKRVMFAYVANNPYRECVSYLPTKHRYYPPLLASTRTNPAFIDGYLEKPTFYAPAKDLNYSGVPREGCITLDEYRNPLCAAISYCVRMGVKRLALFCCDESFADQRPGSEQMQNGLYQYPQQIKSQKIVDAQFYWLRSKGIKIADCSSGIEYKNAAYIKAEDLHNFFDEQ
jgi:hypothetical protein